MEPYICKNKKCEHFFSDGESYHYCDYCEREFCNKECGQLTTYKDDNEVCGFCKEIKDDAFIDDSVILRFLLKHFTITYEEAVELYKIHN